MNKFPFSDDNKRYHTLNYHNMHTYGSKVFKAVIDAGFTCPNIDGSKGVGGCIFCMDGSGYFTQKHSGDIAASVESQLYAEKKRISAKYPDAKITAYFQSNTNTYAPTAVLNAAYNAALGCGVHGISIGTRADCLSQDVIKLLSELNLRTELTVELGLQTIHDKTARIINRCCDYSEFLDGYLRLKDNGIRVCLHMINGLPEETTDDMLDTARTVGRLRPDGLKIHLLHINKNTRLELMYNENRYTPMEKQEYIETVVRQLEYIPAETVIERLTGDADKRYLAAPLWSADKISVLGGIDKLQKEWDSYQGIKAE